MIVENSVDILNVLPQVFTARNTKLIGKRTNIFEIENNVEKVRSYVRSKYEKFGYVGFSNYVDKYYDYFSDYFYVEDENENIVAASRRVKKTINNLLPFEMANLFSNPKSRYVTNDLNTMDINSFVFDNYNAMWFVLKLLVADIDLHKYSKIYCMYDPKNRAIENFYGRTGFIPSDEFNDLIYFPGYGQTVNEEFQPTLWKVMEMPYYGISDFCRKNSAKVG